MAACDKEAIDFYSQAAVSGNTPGPAQSAGTGPQAHRSRPRGVVTAGQLHACFPCGRNRNTVLIYKPATIPGPCMRQWKGIKTSRKR